MAISSPAPAVDRSLRAWLTWAARLKDVQLDPGAGEVRQAGSYPVGLLPAATDHDARPGGPDVHSHLVPDPLDLYPGDAGRLHAAVQHLPDRGILDDYPAGLGVLLACLGHPGPDLPLERAVVSHDSSSRR